MRRRLRGAERPFVGSAGTLLGGLLIARPFFGVVVVEVDDLGIADEASGFRYTARGQWFDGVGGQEANAFCCALWQLSLPDGRAKVARA